MRVVTADLRAALTATATAVSSRPSIPVLGAVHITAAGDGSATFASTDLDTWCSYRCGTDGTDALDVLVSHRTLSNIAKAVRSAVVELGLTDSTLTVTAGKPFWSAPLFKDAPVLAPKMPASVGVIDAEALREMVRATAPAATRENEPAMQSLQFRSAGDVLALSTTDRYRAHLTESPFKANVGSVVAFPPAAHLARLADSLQGEVALYSDQGSGVFGIQDDSTTALLRMIGEKHADLADYLGKFPEPQARTVVDSAELAEALDAVMLAVEVTSGVSTGALFVVSADGFSVAANTEDAAARASVEDYSHDGRGLAVCIRPSYLADALKAMGSVRVELGWIDPKKPVIITADGSVSRCFVMPIRHVSAGWL